MKHFEGPETAAMLAGHNDRPVHLSEIEAKVLERDVARVGRSYGRATAKVRKLRANLRKAEAEVKDLRRQMRLLISARKV